MWNNSLYGNYRYRKFTQIWESVDEFIGDWKSAEIPRLIADKTAQTLYYLLYARYGNSTIASSDETQFKYKLFSIIYMYGPTWEKRLELQAQIRDLKLDELTDGGKAIYNQALNPSTEPSTDTLNELPYINQQNTTKYKKSKVDAYAILANLLETDVTAEFLDRFKSLFLKVVEPEVPLWYVTDLVDDSLEEDEDGN